ncbi:RHS repeat-associated core domain-containing protein [Pseudoalteromonas denitrificans]|uniref:RHS repeat-associated core domain-containing protein n=1 Tax=Pseudoalteromonas denitrificans DSM 6059 TaxID=1123010 RepID=A0A1I1QG21_9GAMM|nr:RHS repeat-associated core domain-containing protein [Pseudoalteromonas denitrificans]SFD18183.1 RHS repeat-associated core domain-containing protein [Pseudoalteromonas denitrificans DSM 6059]
MGNLTIKSDYASQYLYGNKERSAGGKAGPSAVRQLILNSGATADLKYDNNGNLTNSTDGGLSIDYNAAMKPTGISRNGNELAFKYDVNEQRFLQISGAVGNKVTKIYAGNYELELKADGTRVQKAYIGQHSIISTEANQPRIVHTSVDRLGSVTSLTNDDKSLTAGSSQNDLLIQRRAYDIFGRAFEAYSNSSQPFSELSIFEVTKKGFTNHEHLPDVGLIHMNGRGYDPLLGRFLSVDPFIQSPTNTQSVNPYTYIFNNPLSGTDPTGYKSKDNDVKENDDKKPKEPKEKCMQSISKVCSKLGSGGVHFKNSANGKGKNKEEFSAGKPNEGGSVVDKDMANLSKCVYGGECEMPEGWSKLTDDTLAIGGVDPSLLINEDTGFQAAVYYNSDTKAYALAFAGTDPNHTGDIIANVHQGTGFPSAQYEQAVQLASAVKGFVGPNRSLTYVGHSLGGGLASAASLLTLRQAITFNAAGLHGNTTARYSIPVGRAKDFIKAYYVKGELLSSVQDSLSAFPRAVGSRIPLTPVGNASSFQRHDVDEVIKAM